MRNATSSRFLFAAGLAVLLIALPFLHRSVSANSAGQAPAQAADGNITTTLKDQTDLALTVYNSNLSLVRDVRQLTLPSGESLLRFMDIAASINPATVHFRSLTEPAKLNVLEQNYEYDLLDPNKLLQKFVGREVTLVRPKLASGTTEYEEVKATLLSLNGAPVWKIGNEIVTGVSYESIRFPELPENLYERPTLLWTLQNLGARRHRVEASYLTSNLSWNADYVLNVAKDESSGDLDGWVTLVNHSGTAFKNASLQLVAGDIHRVVAQYAMDEVRAMKSIAGAANAPAPFQQESFSEYHLYSLNRRTSIFDQESKQISLLNASHFPLRKVYVVNGQTYYYRTSPQPGAPIKIPYRSSTNSRTKRRPVWECRCPREPFACTKRTRAADRFLPAKITSTTRRKTKRSACTSATRLTSWPNANRRTTGNFPTGCMNSSTRSRCETTRPGPSLSK